MSVIYVGSALTGISEEARRPAASFKELLKQKGHTVLEFVIDPEATNEAVYRNDILECVGKCDLMIAFVDLPSSGLGFEIATALFRFKKPVIAVAHISNENKISRLIKGIGVEVNSDLFKFTTYENIESVANLID